MKHRLLFTAWIASLAAALSTMPGLAQGPILSDPCCHHCGLMPARCTCTTLQPVVETRYRQEAVVGYRDVVRSGARSEPICETVPVTSTRNVMVEQGGWQMVWVSQPAVRQVTETRYEPRMSYRTVPYQFTERVPHVTTRIVPERTVRYVPHEKTMAVGWPIGSGMAFGNSWTGQSIAQPQPGIPLTSAGIAPPPATAVLPAPATGGPALEPASTGASTWTTIQTRSTTNVSVPFGADEEPTGLASPVPPPVESVRAPTAAMVWQSRAGLRRQ
ncbi:MAG: hypothetical protein KY476_23565 [Planctomycetes bacterium]|nr:hypothetical protein [Planctomycetota bacterium]